MRRPTILIITLAFYLILSPLIVSSASLAQRTPDVEVNRKTAVISINATDVPLSAILQRLYELYRIRVFIPNFRDRNVSIVAKDRPIIDLLDELVPTKYWVVVENGELFLSGSSGKKLPRPESAEIVSVEELRTADLEKENMTKRRYGKLIFRIEGGRLILESALILPGKPVVGLTLINDYVYKVELGGKVVQVGSFSDPFRRHVHFPDETRPHEVLHVKSGVFAVLLPEKLLDEALLPKVKIRIFKLVGTPPVQKLSLDTIDKFKKVLKKQYVFKGKDLIGQLREPTRKQE